MGFLLQLVSSARARNKPPGGHGTAKAFPTKPARTCLCVRPGYLRSWASLFLGVGGVKRQNFAVIHPFAEIEVSYL